MRLQSDWVTIPCALLILHASSALGVDKSSRDTSWRPLFNGRDLSGWYTYVENQGNDRDPERIFQIHDGVIHVYKDHKDGGIGPKGYFATRLEYAYYRLRFQYKWGGKKFVPRYDRPPDAGCLYHAVGPDQIWPRSVECQVQEGDTGDCFTVRGTQVNTTVDPMPVSKIEQQFRFPVDGGVERSIGSAKGFRIIKNSTHEVEGWNIVEVIVRGDTEVQHFVNGHLVFEAKNLKQLTPDRKGWLPLTHGRILFQAECAEVFYRNIEIQPLEDGPLHPTSPVPGIRVPDGFELTQVAGPPLVEYPTLACFDDQGRLYVSEGGNVNDPYDVLVKTLPRSIRRLEDTNGDGVFDRFTVFADKMTFPYGGVWHDGALYVASDPSIWRLEDTDGDGVADKRQEIITGFRSEGHASAMKGGYLGRDGRLYFTGGNEGGYDLKGSDGTHLHDPRTAPGVFRMKPDGSQLEFFANGAAGIYDLCFDPSGDLFGVVTILKYPRGDGLMHWIYGGAYQTSRSVSRYAKLTGERLPPLQEWPQTSPSGAMLSESGLFGEGPRRNLFTAHFNTHVVTRNVLERDGSTWRSVHYEDLVQSDDLNCRFTDVLEDADGSLLLLNTGGWFRIGCPTSQVGEGALTGAIYRVQKIGQAKIDDPRGLKLEWSKSGEKSLANRLADPRFAVRDRAMAELASRGQASVPALREIIESGSAEARCHAVWTLTRIDAPGARAAVRKALSDDDETVAQAAVASAGLWRDAEAFDSLIAELRSSSTAIVREAATSLGRLGNSAAVSPLLAVLENGVDRFAEHAVIYALIEIDDRDETLAGLKSSHPAVARGALIALDQMPHGQLTESDVEPLLASFDAGLQQAALKISNRNGWAHGVVPLLTQWLDRPELSSDRQAVLSDSLLSFRGNADVQRLMAERLTGAATSLGTKKLLLAVMARSRLRKLPAAWQEALKTSLRSSNEPLAEEAIATAAAIGRGRFDAELQALALDPARPMPLRLMAASARLAGGRSPASDLFNLLLEHCAAQETDPATRLTIAKALGDARLSVRQLEQMTHLVSIAGPLELPSLLRAYEESAEPVAGEKLCQALAISPGLENLSPLRVQKLFERYPEAVRVLAEPLVGRFNQETEDQARRLDRMKFALDGGDPASGRLVFFGASACSQCHRVGKQGSNIGPDLSRIAEIRTRRDLLEAIVFPSATLARGYEPVTVITTAGKPITGIIRRDTPKEIALLTADRSEVVLPRSEIDDITPSRVSIMPQGLDRNLKPEELRDLLAFLATLKKAK